MRLKNSRKGIASDDERVQHTQSLILVQEFISALLSMFALDPGYDAGAVYLGILHVKMHTYNT